MQNCEVVGDGRRVGNAGSLQIVSFSSRVKGTITKYGYMINIVIQRK